MKRIHIIGGKNHGKTTVIVELVGELTRRGLRVGTIKHTHHSHELDVPGKDSFRHREAGAAAVGILTRGMNAVFWPADDAARTSDTDGRYAAFEPLMVACNVVLVEGDLHARAMKVEVWRAELGTSPLAATHSDIVAVVSDDPADVSVPVLSRSDLSGLADWIAHQAGQ